MAAEAPIKWSPEETSLKQLMQAEERKKSAAAVPPVGRRLSQTQREQLAIQMQQNRGKDAKSLCAFILNLQLNGLGIHELDPLLSTFTSLSELHITNNKVVHLKHIPSSLTQLYACGNRIRTVDFSASKSLMHVGLGFNSLNESCLQSFANLRDSVVSLDLSSNEFGDAQALIEELRRFKHLKHLYLMSNPVSLQRHYRRLLLHHLPELELLDGIEVTEAERKQSDLDANLDAKEAMRVHVKLVSMVGLKIDPLSATSEQPVWPLLAQQLPADFKDKVTYGLQQYQQQGLTPPVGKVSKTTSYFVVFRLAGEELYRSVDLDSDAVAACQAAKAEQAAAQAGADKKGGAKKPDAGKPAAVDELSSSSLELPLNIEAKIEIRPDVQWRNFFALNFLDFFLYRRDVVRAVAEDISEAPAAEDPKKGGKAPPPKKDAKESEPAAVAAPADPNLPPLSFKHLTPEQLEALTQTTERLYAVAHLDTDQFLIPKRNDVEFSLSKRLPFYLEQPNPNPYMGGDALNPKCERRIPSDVFPDDGTSIYSTSSTSSSSSSKERVRIEATMRVKVSLNQLEGDANNMNNEDSEEPAS